MWVNKVKVLLSTSASLFLIDIYRTILTASVILGRFPCTVPTERWYTVILTRWAAFHSFFRVVELASLANKFILFNLPRWPVLCNDVFDYLIQMDFQAFLVLLFGLGLGRWRLPRPARVLQDGPLDLTSLAQPIKECLVELSQLLLVGCSVEDAAELHPAVGWELARHYDEVSLWHRWMPCSAELLLLFVGTDLGGVLLIDWLVDWRSAILRDLVENRIRDLVVVLEWGYVLCESLSVWRILELHGKVWALWFPGGLW